MEKDTITGENDKATRSVSIIRSLLNDPSFFDAHRTEPKFFTRKFKLDFMTVILLILQKSVKSLQVVLNEFFKELGNGVLATNSAFTQARSHLRYQAFITLNQRAIIDVLYGDKKYRGFKGFRVLSVDGSKIHLPNTPEICQEFGTINFTNGKNKQVIGQHGYGLASVMYDVLNKVVLDSVIANAKAYEVDLAIGHLQQTRPSDLLLFDRNYPSYRLLATLTQLPGRHFVIRCSKSSFATARALFEQDIVDSRITTLKPHHEKKNEIRALALPEQITVRFVSVRLSTGELEVLVTSLIDEERYPTETFKEIYHLRWGVEGFYGVIKERLNLENFSSKTVLSVKQDFYGTVFLTGLESILTQPADLQLAIKSEFNKLKQTVNNVVSFNAIKNHVVELFYHPTPIESLLTTLTEWFIMNPTYTGREREVPRKKNSARVSLNYYKRHKKFCF